MMVKKIIKKIIFGVFLLYGYNLIAVSFGFMIPINYITIVLVSLFDIPAMFMLVMSLVFIF